MATLILELSESLKARLEVQAQAQKLSIDLLVRQLLDEHFPEVVSVDGVRRKLPEVRGGNSGDPDLAENIDRELTAKWANDLDRNS